MAERQKKDDAPNPAPTTDVKPAVRTAQPEPKRIKWRGEGEPEAGPLVLGGLTIDLPDAGAQRAGFETEHHHLLVNGGYGYKYVNDRASGREE